MGNLLPRVGEACNPYQIWGADRSMIDALNAQYGFRTLVYFEARAP